MENINLKLNFLKRILTDSLNSTVYDDFFSFGYPNDKIINEAMSHPIEHNRMEGFDSPLRGHTMVGLKRLNNLHDMLDYIRINEIDGDLLEAGVWRGGVTIFMKAYLDFYKIDKKVFVCDSFEGLPKPDLEKYPRDIGDMHHTYNHLKISLDDVISNFSIYGLLDDKVKFIKGWFSDTLHNNDEIKSLSMCRCDGDMYGSTMDVLTNLYDKLSYNSVIIIDDYCLSNCVQAVSDFRNEKNIHNNIEVIDNCGIFWFKN